MAMQDRINLEVRARIGDWIALEYRLQHLIWLQFPHLSICLGKVFLKFIETEPNLS